MGYNPRAWVRVTSELLVFDVVMMNGMIFGAIACGVFRTPHIHMSFTHTIFFRRSVSSFSHLHPFQYTQSLSRPLHISLPLPQVIHLLPPRYFIYLILILPRSLPPSPLFSLSLYLFRTFVFSSPDLFLIYGGFVFLSNFTPYLLPNQQYYHTLCLHSHYSLLPSLLLSIFLFPSISPSPHPPAICLSYDSCCQGHSDPPPLVS